MGAVPSEVATHCLLLFFCFQINPNFPIPNPNCVESGAGIYVNIQSQELCKKKSTRCVQRSLMRSNLIRNTKYKSSNSRLLKSVLFLNEKNQNEAADLDTWWGGDNNNVLSD